VNRRDFILRRLHSLSGVLPIGAYLITHIMLENLFVLGGPERFDMVVKIIGAFPAPLLLGIEVFGLWGPILFHALYGFVRIREAELDNPLRNDRLGAYLYTLQRISGVIAFFFIGYHVWSTRIQYYFANAEIGYAFMHAKMTNPLVLGVYLIGVLASVFHFTNGLWTFCVTWGITVGVRAQRTARMAAMFLFVVMFGASLAILMAFRA
jgi:succinate dehydrogenase / fumarate reductase cytochrome b subunit